MPSTANDDLAATKASAAIGDGHAPRQGSWMLTLGSIGVVYGDIGTSPLYALKEPLHAATAGGGHQSLTRVMVLGSSR